VQLYVGYQGAGPLFIVIPACRCSCEYRCRGTPEAARAALCLRGMVLPLKTQIFDASTFLLCSQRSKLASIELKKCPWLQHWQIRLEQTSELFLRQDIDGKCLGQESRAKSRHCMTLPSFSIDFVEWRCLFTCKLYK